MRELFIVLLFVITISGTSQTTAEVAGEWQFHSLTDALEMEPAKKATLSAMLTTMSLNFEPGERYSGSLIGAIERGTWKIKDGAIEMKNETGEVNLAKIIAYEKNLLTLQVREMPIVFSRKGSAPPPVKLSKVKDVTYISTTTEAVAKKWYLKEKPAPPNLTPAQMEAMGEMMAGSFIEFKKNGTYNYKIGSVMQNGKWKLSGDKKGIETTFKNSTQLWHVQSISNTELIVITGPDNERWVFSSVE